MNRTEAAKTLEVSPNTVKNWADQIYCTLPKTFTQADLTLLQSYKGLTGQEPPLDRDTIVLMLLPLISASTLTKADNFPYVEVAEEQPQAPGPVAGALPPSSGFGVGTMPPAAGGAPGMDATAGLQSFVTDSVYSLTAGMGGYAADAFVGALNTDQFRAAFCARLTELSRSIGPAYNVPAMGQDGRAQTLDANVIGQGASLAPEQTFNSSGVLVEGFEDVPAVDPQGSELATLGDE